MSTLFRTTTSRVRLTALAVGLGAIAALAGCSSDAPEEPQGAVASQPADEQAPATEEAADNAAPAEGADLAITLDGEALEIADPTVVCQEVSGTMTIAIGSMTGADGIGATLTTGDDPVVKTVALGSVDGTAMAWAEGAPGEVNATKDGSTYTISGSMTAVDITDPTNMTDTPFEMTIPCP